VSGENQNTLKSKLQSGSKGRLKNEGLGEKSYSNDSTAREKAGRKLGKKGEEKAKKAKKISV